MLPGLFGSTGVAGPERGTTRAYLALPAMAASKSRSRNALDGPTAKLKIVASLIELLKDSPKMLSHVLSELRHAAVLICPKASSQETDQALLLVKSACLDVQLIDLGGMIGLLSHLK